MNGIAPDARPIEGYCRACGGWILTCAPGTAWARGRCGNRKLNGEPGRKCSLYAQTQRFTFTAHDDASRIAIVSRRL